MPKLPEQMLEQGIKSLREVQRQQCIYYMRPKDPPVDYAPWKSPEDTSFTKAIRKALLRWSAAFSGGCLCMMSWAKTERLSQNLAY